MAYRNYTRDYDKKYVEIICTLPYILIEKIVFIKDNRQKSAKKIDFSDDRSITTILKKRNTFLGSNSQHKYLILHIYDLIIKYLISLRF